MRFFLIVSAVAATLALSGCAPIEPMPISGPSGAQAYTMKCSGAGRTIEMCYAKAGEICPNGYGIVSHSNTSQLVANDSGVNTIRKENLTIECK